MKCFILFALLLSGCATGYQEYSWWNQQGYQETQLAEDMFRVTFKGNAATDRERAEDLTLLRSADLALQNGYNYFVVIDASAYDDVSTYVAPTTTNTYGSATTSASIYGNNISGMTSGYSNSTTYGGQVFNFVKPSVNNTILCFNEKPEGAFSYDAAFISNSLKAKYNIK